MKTKNVVLALAMVVIVSTFTFAAEPASKVAVINQESGVFKVIYEGAKAGRVSLKIYDNTNALVFEETIRGLDKFSIPMNFSGMNQGEYTIEISDASGKQVQKINYKIETAAKRINQPKFSASKNVFVSKIGTENKYLMSVLNKGTSEFKVRIFDEDNNLLHNENLTINGDFAIVYNLEKVNGTPTFKVTNKVAAQEVK